MGENATAREAGPGAEYVQVGDERWASVYLYTDPKAVGETLIHAVRPVVDALYAKRGIDGFFFVRYTDDRGFHVRFRLRLVEADFESCLQEIRACQLPGNELIVVPFEPEMERYGGGAALPASLDFFCVSSCHALAFEADFGSYPPARRMTLVLCLLIWQAWGLAENVAEFENLLDYYSVGYELYPKVLAAAGQSFERNGPSLAKLVSREFLRLLELDDPAEPSVSLNSAQSLVHAGRALSHSLGSLTGTPRWSVLSSQMHMTANRLGLKNSEEAFATQLLTLALRSMRETEASLWSAIVDCFGARESLSGDGRALLRTEVDAHLRALGLLELDA